MIMVNLYDYTSQDHFHAPDSLEPSYRKGVTKNVHLSENLKTVLHSECCPKQIDLVNKLLHYYFKILKFTKCAFLYFRLRVMI